MNINFMDQPNNEIHENRYSTNTGETTVFCVFKTYLFYGGMGEDLVSLSLSQRKSKFDKY